MGLLFANQGEVVGLKAIVNHTAPQDLVLRLYQNNKSPADGDTEASYTEATFTGYDHKDLAGASWSFTAGAPSYAEYAQQVFTSSADQTTQNIYGYYLTQVTSGLLIYAERFGDGPYPVTNNGDTIKVTPHVDAYKVGEP